jgi:hypothetical protein
MRDLESQIARWRRAMRASGINRSDTLDELEDHLRDDIERRMRLGAGTQQAFEMATGSIGQPQTLRSEFQKLQLLQTMKRKITDALVIATIIAILVALLLPAVSKVKAHQALAAWDIAGCFLIAVMIVGGAIYASKKRLKS